MTPPELRFVKPETVPVKLVPVGIETGTVPVETKFTGATATTGERGEVDSNGVLILGATVIGVTVEVEVVVVGGGVDVATGVVVVVSCKVGSSTVGEAAKAGAGKTLKNASITQIEREAARFIFLSSSRRLPRR